MGDPRIRVRGAPVIKAQVPLIGQSALKKPVQLPTLKRTEQEKKDRKREIDARTPVNGDAFIILRHAVEEKVGIIYAPSGYQEAENKMTRTGTVLKVARAYERRCKKAIEEGELHEDEVIKKGMYIEFTPYAPFMCAGSFQEVQLIYAENIVAYLDEIPEGFREP
jgi:hypothetical protein